MLPALKIRSVTDAREFCSNVEISSTHASMSLGEGKIRLIGASTSTMTLGTGASSVTMSADGTDTLIALGSKTNFSHKGCKIRNECSSESKGVLVS